MSKFTPKIGFGEFLQFTRTFAWTCVFFSGASLILGILLLLLSALGVFPSTAVSLKNVQAELDKKTPSTGFGAEIDELRGQFAHLDDERWSRAKELIAGWVEGWSSNPKERSRFVGEIKNVANNFPPERRSAAVDAFYRLKQEKRQETAMRQQTSWLLQLGTFSGILVSLIVFGIFSLLLTLLKIEKNTRNNRGA